MGHCTYPVYIISKGRWRLRHTSRALEKMALPYHIVIEPQEYDQYAAVIDPAKILVLPFSNLGMGSIPARNWVWDHATATGAKRHWILDDNIDFFAYFNKNRYWEDPDGFTFRQCEKFTDQYANLPMSGMQYSSFTIRKAKYPKPFILNTRVYSITLLTNNTAFRWRGRYNEDTDLSLRFLKAGYCTVLFYAFVANKLATMTQKGGNTDQLYLQNDNFDGRLAMAQHLQAQHPDVTTIKRRWGRWQHVVDYSSFRNNKLVPANTTNTVLI
jgi:hypothetical protein